jgi:zinc protease
VQTLRLLVDEYARLQKEPVDGRELRGAQDFMSGNFPLSIETPASIAEQVLGRLFYGQDLKDLETYRERVDHVTVGDITRVSREFLKPDQLAIVLVGDAQTFVADLQALGFADFERIPLAQLDLNSPTLRRPSVPGRDRSRPGRPLPPA